MHASVTTIACAENESVATPNSLLPASRKASFPLCGRNSYLENTHGLVPPKILSDAEVSYHKIIDSAHGSLLVRNIYYQSLLLSVCHQRSCIVRNITSWNVTSSETDLEDL